MIATRFFTVKFCCKTENIHTLDFHKDKHYYLIISVYGYTRTGISFGLKAQNIDLNNNTDYVRIQKNGESGFSRAFGLNSSNHMYIGSVEKTIGNIYFFNKGTDHLMTIKSDGNVGIGTTNPTKKFEIRGNDGIGIRLFNQTANTWDILNSQYGKLDFVRGGSNIFMRITQNGNIGIGTPNPSKKLEIKGDDGVGIRIFNQTANTWDILNSQYGKLDFVRGGSNIFMRIDQNGNVGVGTSNPGSWKLAVNGNIRAKEIKVETGWSDFVFYDDYKLPSLQEVETYIKEKGHLKDIPSAKEVEKNGIFLGEMDSKLLQKIEELTLYTIQQEKKIKEQSEKIESLESLNEKLLDLQKRLEKLENKYCQCLITSLRAARRAKHEDSVD